MDTVVPLPPPLDVLSVRADCQGGAPLRYRVILGKQTVGTVSLPQPGTHTHRVYCSRHGHRLTDSAPSTSEGCRALWEHLHAPAVAEDQASSAA